MLIFKPMLAKAGSLPEEQADYGYEIKWDGLRAICYIKDNQATVMSRNNKDITAQYPELHRLGISMNNRKLVLDGEIIAYNNQGLPSFSDLQHRMGLSDAKAIEAKMQEIPVQYIIFDILLFNNRSCLDLMYTERRKLLAELELNGPSWQTPDYKTGDGNTILAASRQLGLEGIIAKRLDSPYQPGKRTGAWIKIKNQRRQELVIGGWVPGQGNRHGQIGALLIGYYDQSNRFIYAGKAGTGFTRNTLDRLSRLLKPHEQDMNPFSTDPRVPNAVYVTPLFVGEFEFTEWTPNGTLRHPAFKGLRTDIEPHQVTREPTQ
ncbi:MAG TPA: non-homologous end-joining DNA ligase [Methylomusa anaerophila]|uniref:DNA ligase (ATP) n=1 Tax=Methylomusa anaerophila TaxID=1930071 RepID=A0A348ANG3_9FIRM|nr:non-homologous end-joining DNA ligase [Methylomusa anaerophila]BBB92611.1 putative DNA ligase-like protein/MT0965 [Methylomusa anaerophila]HML87535.1 non-homologous end-joining DNA ligase [Methylomusa anaerophila]